MNKFYINREEALLLIIDLQEKLLPVISKGETVINNTDILISIANNLNIPVIYTEQYPKGIGPTVEKLKQNLNNSIKFEKMSFSACSEEGFLNNIKKTNKKKIIVAGAETHICVFQTIRDLLSCDYIVFVPFDAVGSRKEENKNNALSLLRDMGAIITNTELIAFDLIKISGTHEFKEVLKLVK